tara:strand:- start:225 stop:446 length:222 start_codon:yes stop_codon:yes gene_type:complete
MARGGVVGIILRWASSLRFPIVFGLMAVLFILNLFIPDVIPFVDEILMGLLAVLLGSLRKKPVLEESADSRND